MIARVLTAMPIGFDSKLITVECDITKGLPAFNIVGLPDKAVAESKERVRAAISNSDLTFPAKRITINLTPANIAKEGSHLDLPIAISILVASGQLQQNDIASLMFAGELSLDGNIQPIKAAISVAECAKKSGCEKIILPVQNINQASLITKINVVGSTTLSDVVLHILLNKPLRSPLIDDVKKSTIDTFLIDDIRGQQNAKRALAIAAAGHHNILFNGPPGSGKTMLARALPALLPTLTNAEIIETTKIHSLVTNDDTIITSRPFRSPHSTASFVSLIGGGAKVKPGEISLAHNGVLFMDEVPEFQRLALEALRQPLEDRSINVSRANDKITFPANFMLVATMNPCPCGFLGDEKQECLCTQQAILNYQKRLSGPLLDRIDMFVSVARVPKDKMFSTPEIPDEHSGKDIRATIQKAHDTQINRQNKLNASLSNKQLERYAPLDQPSKQLLLSAVETLNLSARSYFKIIRLARTIADLNSHDQIDTSDIAEALQYRRTT